MSEEKKMFQEERIKKIVNFIKSHGRATVDELSRKFNVSPVTVRRDLILIEKNFEIKRTHGGAVNFISESTEFEFMEKYKQNISLKKRMANQAVKQIKDKSIISFDGGSSNYFIAKELDRFGSLKIITNSIPIAYLLKDYNHDLIIAGGNIRKKSLSVVGPFVNEFIGRFKIDTCFIGATGIDMNGDLFSPNEFEAATKRVFMKSGIFKILIADATKINMHSFAKFANLSEFDMWITTKEADKKKIDKLRKINPNIILA